MVPAKISSAITALVPSILAPLTTMPSSSCDTMWATTSCACSDAVLALLACGFWINVCDEQVTLADVIEIGGEGVGARGVESAHHGKADHDTAQRVGEMVRRAAEKAEIERRPFGDGVAALHQIGMRARQRPGAMHARLA